jgi:hypothetical protein
VTVTGDPPDIRPGDIYEDGAYHPVLCTHRDDDYIQGISLIDASTPHGCSLTHCGVAALTIADVIAARTDWPGYRASREAQFEAEHSQPPSGATTPATPAEEKIV